MIVVPKSGIGTDDTPRLKSRANSKIGSSSMISEENIEAVAALKNTEIPHPSAVSVPVPVVSIAPPNLSGFMGTKSKGSGSRTKIVPKIAIIVEVKESIPIPIIPSILPTPVNLPVINTAEFPIDRYLPPAEGILNMRVYDAIALKNEYKIMTAVEREFILEMGKESGKNENVLICKKRFLLHKTRTFVTYCICPFFTHYFFLSFYPYK